MTTKTMVILAAMALIWLVLFGLISGLLGMGNCLQEAACWNGKNRLETIAIVFLGASYLVVAWRVIRSGKP